MLGLIGADSGMSAECKVARYIKCERIPPQKMKVRCNSLFFLAFSFFFLALGATFEVHFNTSSNE